MAQAPDPTADTIVIEGLKRAGQFSPSAALITRAKDEWLEEIKTEIWLQTTTHELLQETQVTVLNEGQQRYDVPPDYNQTISLDVLDGPDDNRGTAQAGTANTITLKATDTATAQDRIGKECFITGGTGIGQIRTISAYNPSTKVATVDVNWTTIPDSTSTYLIVTDYIPLDLSPKWVDIGTRLKQTLRGRPERAAYYKEQYWLHPVPDDKKRGLRLSYYVDLIRLDLASALLSKLFREWRAIWVQGIRVKAMQHFDDDRVASELQVYLAMLQALGAKQAEVSAVEYRDF